MMHRPNPENSLPTPPRPEYFSPSRSSGFPPHAAAPGSGYAAPPEQVSKPKVVTLAPKIEKNWNELPEETKQQINRMLYQDAQRYRPAVSGRGKVKTWLGLMGGVVVLLGAPILIDPGTPGDFPGQKTDDPIYIGEESVVGFDGPRLGTCYDKSEQMPYGTSYTCGDASIQTVAMDGNSNLDTVMTRSARAMDDITLPDGFRTVTVQNGTWVSRLGLFTEDASNTRLSEPDNATAIVTFAKKDDDSKIAVVSITGVNGSQTKELVDKIYQSLNLENGIDQANSARFSMRDYVPWNELNPGGKNNNPEAPALPEEFSTRPA